MASHGRDSDSPRKPDTFGAPGQYDENGVDLSLIRDNMRVTPTERARRGDRARRDALRVQKLGFALQRQAIKRLREQEGLR